MAADTIAIIGTQVITILGVLYYLGPRIDSLGRDLRGEIAELRREVASTRAALSARLDAHIERHAG